MTASAVIDKEFHAALVKRARNFRERVPVFPIQQPVTEESVAQARGLALDIWNPVLRCLLIPPNVGAAQTRMQLPHNGRVDVFHPSGAISAKMKSPQQHKPFDSKKGAPDRALLKRKAAQVSEALAKGYLSSNEELLFESFWELNAQTVTLKGEKSGPFLFEVVSSFRRFLHGLPVLGRASIHVGLGDGPQVTRWGVDWRRVRPDPLAETPVISPEEGAQRVLTDMAWRRPGRPFTAKDFEIKDFVLGYMSFSRRVPQSVMQPVWVAVLTPLSKFTMAHVVAVPAAPQPFESLARAPSVPPRK